MENTVTLGDSVQKLTLTGDEAIIALDGRNIKIPLSSLKQYLDIQSFGVVIPEKAPSMNLGAPADPKVYFGGAGEYFLNDSVLEVTEVLNIFLWNKTKWSVLGVQIEVETTVDVITSDGKKPTSQKAIYDYTVKKEITDTMNYGVVDANNNLIFWFDKDNKFHAVIPKESLPTPDVQIGGTNFFDFAIVGLNGEIVFGIKDGVIFPEQQSQSTAGNDSSSFINTQEYKTQEVSKDGIWNQWIDPVAVTDKEGSLWFSTISTDGNIYLTKKTLDGRLAKRKLGAILSNLGSFKSDDHNAPAILLDDRVGAEFPIIIFQCDHNTTPMRYWRFSSLDITKFDMDSYDQIVINPAIPSADFVAYSQPHRYGDEIFVFCRRPALPRPWRVSYSPDNGATWNRQNIFSAAAEWLYMLTKDKADGSGVHLMCYGHPDNSSDQNIYYLDFDFATGAVSNPATGVVIPDLRAAIANASFVPIDPLVVGRKIYQAVGLEKTRMWDYKEWGSNISLLFTSQTIPTFNVDGYESSRYKVVNFSFVNGTINNLTELGKAGYGIEQSSYWAGGCLISATKAYLCKWTPQSVIDGGNDIYDPKGLSEMYMVDFANPLALIIGNVGTSNLKVIRPLVTKDSKYMVICECKYFTTYDDFYSNVLIEEVENLT